MNDIPTIAELSEDAKHEVSKLTAPLANAIDSLDPTEGEKIGFTLVGGLVIGLVVGALLPFGRRRKSSKKTTRALASTMAATISELTKTLAAARDQAETTAGDAHEKLDDAGRTIGKSIHDHSESLAKQSKKLADDAADQLNDGGKAIARLVVKLVEKARG